MTFVWLLLGLAGGMLFVALVRQRRRSYYVGLVVAAFIYLLFAMMNGAEPIWIMAEFGGVFLFSMIGRVGLHRNIAVLGVAWLLHPVWDVALHLFGPGASFTPSWYPLACITFDGWVGVYLISQRDRL